MLLHDPFEVFYVLHQSLVYGMFPSAKSATIRGSYQSILDPHIYECLSTSASAPIRGSSRTAPVSTYQSIKVMDDTLIKDQHIARNSQEWKNAKEQMASHGKKGTRNLGLGTNISQDLVEASKHTTSKSKVQPKRDIVEPSKLATNRTKGKHKLGKFASIPTTKQCIQVLQEQNKHQNIRNIA